MIRLPPILLSPISSLGDHQVPSCTPNLHVLRESPGVPTDHHAAFPADVGLVEVPQQDKSLPASVMPPVVAVTRLGQ